MANEAAHIELAVRNQAALDKLCDDPAAFGEWITTIAFYKALQIVEAVFANEKPPYHSSDHGSRNDRLVKINRYEKIWRSYGDLYRASQVARYLTDHPLGSSGKYTRYGDLIKSEDLIGMVVDHWLKGVKQSAAKFLSNQAKRQLGIMPTPAKTKLKKK